MKSSCIWIYKLFFKGWIGSESSSDQNLSNNFKFNSNFTYRVLISIRFSTLIEKGFRNSKKTRCRQQQSQQKVGEKLKRKMSVLLFTLHVKFLKFFSWQISENQHLKFRFAKPLETTLREFIMLTNKSMLFFKL